MVHFARCPNQEGWIDEGASELATRVAGYEGPPRCARGPARVQLNAWSPANWPELIRHYQASYLFLRYVGRTRRRLGRSAADCSGMCARGEALFAAFLSAISTAADVEACLPTGQSPICVQDPAVADGRYAYRRGVPRVGHRHGRREPERRSSGPVPQYAANYIELPPGGHARDVPRRPDGAALSTAPRARPRAPGGAIAAIAWTARLTRRVDLSASVDGDADVPGVVRPRRPVRLRVPQRVARQRRHLAGPAWSAHRRRRRDWQQLRRRLDGIIERPVGRRRGRLSSYAGSGRAAAVRVLTDQSYNGQGFALRDVAVPRSGCRNQVLSMAAGRRTAGSASMRPCRNGGTCASCSGRPRSPGSSPSR